MTNPIAAAKDAAAMAIKGVSMAEREAVVLPHDPGHPSNPAYITAKEKGVEPEEATTFYIGNLSKACRIEIGDMAASPTLKDGGVTMDMRNTKRMYTIVQRGLMDWSNMLDHEGKPVKFELTTVQTAGGFVKGASDNMMQLLGADDLKALSETILQKNGITRQVEGNSEELLPPSADLLSEVGIATPAPTSNRKKEVAL